jgi:hypothetical protein
LYFAEIEECEPGQRVFNVSLQGRTVLENFDIAREAGGANRTVVREFKGINVKDDLKVALCVAGILPAPEGGTRSTRQAEPLLCGIEIIAEGW